MYRPITDNLDIESLVNFIEPQKVLGLYSPVITGVASLEDAKSEHLAFCNIHGEIAAKNIAASKAGAVLCHSDVLLDENDLAGKCLVVVDNPRLAFIRCLNHFFVKDVDWNIHPSAIVSDDAILSKRVSVGPMVCIGPGVEIDEGTVIESRVSIISNAKIGKNVYIQSGSVIGCEGQGFERNEKGAFEKFLQFGSVVLEDDVEIGANSTIVRGAFAETRIGKGSKIGHLTDIGHNVQIGRHVFVSAGVVVCGSVVVGDYSWLAPKCCIRNKIRIGREVTVGLGSVVVSDVPEGRTVVGIPAIPIKKGK